MPHINKPPRSGLVRCVGDAAVGFRGHPFFSLCGSGAVFANARTRCCFRWGWAIGGGRIRPQPSFGMCLTFSFAAKPWEWLHRFVERRQI